MEVHLLMSDKTTVRTSTKKGRSTKKTNLLRLFSAMNKFAFEANDKEIIKRFKILIDASDTDLTKTQVDNILKQIPEIDILSYHEGLQPYVKHYLFMAKRTNKEKI